VVRFEKEIGMFNHKIMQRKRAAWRSSVSPIDRAESLRRVATMPTTKLSGKNNPWTDDPDGSKADAIMRNNGDLP
jgi:hypothetical protein